MIRIIIPAYNESKNIDKCISKIDGAVSQKHRIYVINDGSKDDTLEKLHILSREFPITIINHKVNKGVAEAFRSGISKVLKEGGEKDIVVIMEGDGTSDSSLLPLMINKIVNGYDVVIASRYLKGGGYKNFPLKRLILSKLANYILHILYPYEEVRDYTIFFRTYSFKIIQRAKKEYKDKLISTKYFAANAEILIKMIKLKPNITEVPFLYNYGLRKGRGGLKISENLIQYLKFMVKTKI